MIEIMVGFMPVVLTASLVFISNEVLVNIIVIILIIVIIFISCYALRKMFCLIRSSIKPLRKGLVLVKCTMNRMLQLDGESLLLFMGVFTLCWFYSPFSTISQQCRFQITSLTLLPMVVFAISFLTCLYQIGIISKTLRENKRIWICLSSSKKLHQSLFLELQPDNVLLGCWHFRLDNVPYGGEITIKGPKINYIFAFFRVIISRARLIIDLFLRGEKGAAFRKHTTDESHYKSSLDTDSVFLPYKRLETTEKNFPLFVIREIQKKFNIDEEELIKTMTYSLEYDLWIYPPFIDPVKDRTLNSIQLQSEDCFTSQDGISELKPKETSD